MRILYICLLCLLALFIILSFSYKFYESFTQNNILSIDNIKTITKKISIYRPVQSTNLSKVKTYIINELNKIPKFIVQEQKFTRIINNIQYNFSNIIATNSNQRPKIILGAHLDSPQIDGIQATIDACTSIAIIIEIISKLSETNNDLPIQVVFFDGEEAIDGTWKSSNTLSGSRYFVSNLEYKPEQVIICDLIGGDINTNKIYGFASNPNSIQVVNDLAKYSSEIFVSNILSYKTITADHTPFIEANIPATILIPETFPWSHHTLNDNLTNVNWDYVEKFANGLYSYLYNKIF